MDKPIKSEQRNYTMTIPKARYSQKQIKET